jgi:hypothetical protein
MVHFNVLTSCGTTQKEVNKQERVAYLRSIDIMVYRYEGDWRRLRNTCDGCMGDLNPFSENMSIFAV